MAPLKQWPRKVECTLCAEPHMVDARGLKQHQNKVRSEQGATLVVKNDPVDVELYARGFVEGWRAAMAEAGKSQSVAA